MLLLWELLSLTYAALSTCIFFGDTASVLKVLGDWLWFYPIPRIFPI
jgi:hypothetical protein